MGAFKSAVITKKGQELLAKVVAGTTKLEFTKIKVSDTKLSGDLASMTGIGTIKQEEKVASVVRKNGSNVTVSASFSNQTLGQGYYVRNLGLYANDPQAGEILYSISVADESTATADYMPPFNGIGVSSLMVDLVTAVSNASSVKVNVDPTAGATVAQIVNLQEQIDDVKSFVGYESSDVYGVEVDFVNKKFTRLAGAENLTSGADFDKLTPWGGRKRCNLTNEGVMVAYRGETGYSEAGATSATITKGTTEYPSGTKVQTMVEQPLFYTKVVPVKSSVSSSGRGKKYDKAKFYISPTPKAGFKPVDGFLDDNGILQDKIYLSAFEGSIFDTLLRKSTCKTFKRRMLSISSKRENNVSPTYSEWCSFNSYVGWLQHCDSFRLYQKYVEPNVEYMHNYYLKEVKGNAEICKRKNYSGERKAS